MFGKTERIFKEYVRGVCSERGYSNNETWTVATAYGFGNSMSGGLDAHVGQIYERMKNDLTGYGPTRRWANRAADAICPPKSGGGGHPPGSFGEIRRPFRTMMTMITGIESFFVHITSFMDSGERRSNTLPAAQQMPASALFTYRVPPYQNQYYLMFPVPAWQLYAPPMPVMAR